MKRRHYMLISAGAAALLLALALILYFSLRTPRYDLSYLATEGGSISGDSTQRVAEGAEGEEVRAVAENGFRFVKWSDGLTEPTRTDGQPTDDLTLTAEFEKINVTLTYDDGSERSLPLLELFTLPDSSLYPAKPNYTYLGWHVTGEEPNGEDALPLLEQRLNGKGICDIPDLAFTVAYERIYVDFYAEGYLVRHLPLDTLAANNLSSLVAYSSRYTFDGWSFSVDTLLDDPALVTVDDPLSYLAEAQAAGDIANTGTLQLVADFKEKTTPTSPAENYTVAHAMGSANGVKNLNTLEGFFEHYNRGQRFFEVDIAVTADSRSVLFHLSYTNGDHTKPWIVEETLAEFLADPPDGLTRVTLEDLIYLMRICDDIVIDFDVLSAYNGYLHAGTNKYKGIEVFLDELEALVGTDTALYDRMMMELLPEVEDAMLLRCKAMGFTKFLYCYTEYLENDHLLYDTELLRASLEWCVANGITYMSCNDMPLEHVALAKSLGVRVLFYTFNDPIEIYRLLDAGVDGVFSDFTFF